MGLFYLLELVCNQCGATVQTRIEAAWNGQPYWPHVETAGWWLPGRDDSTLDTVFCPACLKAAGIKGAG